MLLGPGYWALPLVARWPLPLVGGFAWVARVGPRRRGVDTLSCSWHTYGVRVTVAFTEGVDMFNGQPGVVYAVVIAHREGGAVERLALDTLGTWGEATAKADAWTRRHGHRELDTDRCGFYSYVDRANRPVCSQFRVNVASVR